MLILSSFLSLQTDDNEITSLATAHKAMKSLKDLVPCEFSREAITQSADELINSLNAKRKQDTEMFQDCKKTFELQVGSSIVDLEKMWIVFPWHIFQMTKQKSVCVFTVTC